ncbi:MAG: DNA polymerase III subunit delta [Bacilli bacterium]|jgi:DNA polymerase-3 subunit delta|nr:DNA polymerase III subunit delta [Bacilli bacterium]
MLYLVYGDQTAMIKNRLKKIIKERIDVADEVNFVKYDVSEVSLFEIIDEANRTPLGYDRKLIVLDNCYFLSSRKVKTKIDNEEALTSLVKYLTRPNESTDLVFVLNAASIDEKNDIVRLIKENAKTFQLLSLDKKDWDEYIYKYFLESLKTKIDRDAAHELALRVQGDLELFTVEAQKLALYTSHVTFEDVCLLTTKPLEENTFEIFNHLLNRKNQAAVALFRDLRVSNIEPVSLISMLANQFRLLWQVVFLTKQGKTSDDIASILNIKEIRVRIIKRNAYTMSMDALQEVLDTLYSLDMKIKSGQVDRFYAFELFLINFKIE